MRTAILTDHQVRIINNELLIITAAFLFFKVAFCKMQLKGNEHLLCCSIENCSDIFSYSALSGHCRPSKVLTLYHNTNCVVL